MTKIAILGTGNVGNSLWEGLDKNLNEVKFGSRNPSKAKVPEEAEVWPLSKAAKWADAIILAVPHLVVRDVIVAAGIQNFNGKTLIDATNALNDKWELSIGFDTSAAEEIQKLVPEARVVKAFNTVFASNMKNGKINGETLSLFVASDDKKAKELVMSLGSQIGFEPIDAGPLKSARYLEPMGVLMISLGFQGKLGTGIGFKIIRQKK